ncbi:MAG TPA: TMEM175 family protein [Trebonia sp.]|nr:TMEM175 family protein [Trebonia sp.]
MRTSRLEAFSDGVLAIIITIMVLELREPRGDTLASLWHSAGTGMLSYLLSFVYVGIYWANHHHMFQLTEHVTGGVLWANLSLLFFLSLFPYTTEWTNASEYARVPVVVYGVNLLLAAIAYYILQTSIIRTQGDGSALRRAIGRDIKGKISPAGYIAGIVAGLASGTTGAGRAGVWIAMACYVGVAAMWIIPDRRIETTITVEEPPADPERHR